MHTQTIKTTVTFLRPFQLDGFEAVLPAGVYGVESENDVLDGMFLPDCLRPSVLIHLHATPGSSGHAQTLTVPWAVLEVALLRDRSPATTALNGEFSLSVVIARCKEAPTGALRWRLAVSRTCAAP